MEEMDFTALLAQYLGKGKHGFNPIMKYGIEACGSKLMEYKECFEIMGKDRNSYSKTDLEVTFDVSIIAQPIKYTKSSCCMRSVEISTKIIVFCTIRSRNLREKKRKTQLN